MQTAEKLAPKGVELTLHLLTELGPLTAERLHALLWACDSEHYRRHLKPITEFVYVKGPKGPMATLPSSALGP